MKADKSMVWKFLRLQEKYFKGFQINVYGTEGTGDDGFIRLNGEIGHS